METVQQQRERVLALRLKVAQQREQAEQERIRALKHHYVARVNGKVVLAPGKPPTGSVGKFHGKTGTVTRSSKGRTSQKPNGYATYIIPWWENQQVVMY